MPEKPKQEMSEYGNYPLNQTEEQYMDNLRSWQEETNGVFEDISRVLTPELRARVSNIWKKAQDLAERICIEKDEGARERMSDAWDSAKEGCPFTAVASVGNYFREEGEPTNPMKNKPYTAAEIYEAAKDIGEDGIEVGVEGIVKNLDISPNALDTSFDIHDSTGKISCVAIYEGSRRSELENALRNASKKNIPLKIDGYVMPPDSPEEVFVSADVIHVSADMIYPESHVQFKMMNESD